MARGTENSSLRQPPSARFVLMTHSARPGPRGRPVPYYASNLAMEETVASSWLEHRSSSDLPIFGIYGAVRPDFSFSSESLASRAGCIFPCTHRSAGRSGSRMSRSTSPKRSAAERRTASSSFAAPTRSTGTGLLPTTTSRTARQRRKLLPSRSSIARSGPPH